MKSYSDMRREVREHTLLRPAWSVIAGARGSTIGVPTRLAAVG